MYHTLISKSAEETKEAGKRLAGFLDKGDTVALTGDLGTGKTTFTKGIAKGLGVTRPEYVNSPSYVLIREHDGPIRLYHFDLYRLDNIKEIGYIGIQEYLDSDGVVVIEWAEKLSSLMPPEYIHVGIKTITDKERRLEFKGHGKRYADIISRYLVS